MVRTVAAMLAIVGLLAGCARRAAPGFPTDETHAVEAPGPPVDLGSTYPLAPGVRRYWLGGPDEPGEWTERAVRALSDGRVELVESTRAGETLSRVTLSRTPEGSVVIHETARPARNLLTRFDPPLLFAPAGLAPGETAEQTLRVETFTLDDPPRPRGAGTGAHVLTREPDRVSPADPSQRWATLESRLDIRFGAARVRTVSRYLLDAPPGAGLRERAAVRTVRVLGVTVEEEHERLSRFSTSDPPVDSPRSAEPADSP